MIDREFVQASMEGTYRQLRRCTVILAFLPTPVMILVAYYLYGCSLQESVSEYYHRGMRDLFVASNVGIACCLFFYKGFSNRENLALNISALGILIVSFFPMSYGTPTCAPYAPVYENPQLHFIGALKFFFAHGLCVHFPLK